MTDLAPHLLAIMQANGGTLRPADVVSAAADPNSPLHPYFEWDDARAAHEHRIEQARGLIRTVRCDVAVNNTIVRVPVYVRDPGAQPDEAGYVLRDAIKDKPRQLAVVKAEIKAAVACY